MFCSYCNQENTPKLDVCFFCGAPLNVNRPKLNGFVYLELCERPFPILAELHTYDLLLLLRLVRERRSDAYKQMRILQKAKGISVPLDLLEFGEKDYQFYTARMKIIEGILTDRMGYKPRRVDDMLLQKLKEKIERD